MCKYTADEGAEDVPFYKTVKVGDRVNGQDAYGTSYVNAEVIGIDEEHQTERLLVDAPYALFGGEWLVNDSVTAGGEVAPAETSSLLPVDDGTGE